MGRKIAANHIATAYPWALASPGPSVCDPKIQTSSEFLKFLFYHKEFPFFFFPWDFEDVQNGTDL